MPDDDDRGVPTQIQPPIDSRTGLPLGDIPPPSNVRTAPDPAPVDPRDPSS